MHRIRLDIDETTLEQLFFERALSIDDFNSVNPEGKQQIRKLFLRAAAAHVKQVPKHKS